MTGLLPKGHKTTGAKTGQPEKAEDNWQATEATKLAKPNLRTTLVTNPPEKQNPTVNRNSPTRLQAEAAGTKAHNLSSNKSPCSTKNANPKEPATTKAAGGTT